MFRPSKNLVGTIEVDEPEKWESPTFMNCLFGKAKWKDYFKMPQSVRMHWTLETNEDTLEQPAAAPPNYQQNTPPSAPRKTKSTSRVRNVKFMEAKPLPRKVVVSRSTISSLSDRINHLESSVAKLKENTKHSSSRQKIEDTPKKYTKNKKPSLELFTASPGVSSIQNHNRFVGGHDDSSDDNPYYSEQDNDKVVEMRIGFHPPKSQRKKKPKVDPNSQACYLHDSPPQSRRTDSLSRSSRKDSYKAIKVNQKCSLQRAAPSSSQQTCSSKCDISMQPFVKACSCGCTIIAGVCTPAQVFNDANISPVKIQHYDTEPESPKRETRSARCCSCSRVDAYLSVNDQNTKSENSSTMHLSQELIKQAADITELKQLVETCLVKLDTIGTNICPCPDKIVLNTNVRDYGCGSDSSVCQPCGRYKYAPDASTVRESPAPEPVVENVEPIEENIEPVQEINSSEDEYETRPCGCCSPCCRCCKRKKKAKKVKPEMKFRVRKWCCCFPCCCCCKYKRVK